MALIGLAIPPLFVICMKLAAWFSLEMNGVLPNFLAQVVFAPGFLIAFLFGKLLAHQDDPIHMWNHVLIFVGSPLCWATMTGAVGLFIDLHVRGKG